MSAVITQVLARAFAKADLAGGAEAVEWDGVERYFYVPSATQPGRGYSLGPNQGGRHHDGTVPDRVLPWFEQLICSCPAQEAGFSICWHKAAVKLWCEKHGTPYGFKV